MPVLVSADRQGAPLRRGGREAHRRLVLERAAGARVRPVAQPEYDYELPASDDQALQLHRRVRRPAEGRASPTGRARGAEARGRGARGGSSTQQLEALQRRGRRARARRAARRRTATRVVVDLVAGGRRGAARLRRRARRGRLVEEIEERDPRDVGRRDEARSTYELGGRRRARPSVDGQGDEGEGAAAARRRARARRPASSTRSTSCAPTSSSRIREQIEEEVEAAVPRRRGRRARRGVERSSPPGRSSRRARASCSPASSQSLERAGSTPETYLAADGQTPQQLERAPARRGDAVGRARARARGGRRQARHRGHRRRDPRVIREHAEARARRPTRSSRSSSPRGRHERSARTCA